MAMLNLANLKAPKPMAPTKVTSMAKDKAVAMPKAPKVTKPASSTKKAKVATSTPSFAGGLAGALAQKNLV